MNSKKITGQQIRMARVALKWRVDDLSKYSELPWARLQKFERTDDFLPNDAKTDKLINLFEKNNIIFENEDQRYKPYIKIKNEQ